MDPLIVSNLQVHQVLDWQFHQTQQTPCVCALDRTLDDL
jgi:hypothetical protein